MSDYASVMGPRKFRDALKNMEVVFRNMTDDQAEVYYEHLKRVPERVLKEAVSIVIENYRGKDIPPVAIILDAVTDVRRSSPPGHYDTRPLCDKCDDTGYIQSALQEETFCGKKYMVAKQCSCAAGRVRKEKDRKERKGE